MANRFRRELGLIFTWLLFPLVPVVLEDSYYAISVLNFSGSARSGPDPHVWNWLNWVIVLGPLFGFGFLAGATVRLPDVPAVPRRHVRNLLARRGVWVAVGPWWGAIVCVAVFFGWVYLWPAATPWDPQLPKSWEGTWAGTILAWELAALFWFFITLIAGLWAYSWLWPAFAALGRAARIGQWKQTFLRGLFVACAFVGSLFGSFWAATAMWRSYFFDGSYPWRVLRRASW